MKEEINLKPLRILIDKHKNHTGKYPIVFRNLDLIIYPGVLNPNYTKVSGLLADNITVPVGSRVLDMFCGSGAIGFIQAQNAKNILGVDISPISIRCAEENAQNLFLENKTEYRVSNLWEKINEGEIFDVIVANPPLLPILPHTEFEKSFADSPDMNITKEFIAGCPNHLSLGGIVYITTSNTTDSKNSENKSENLAIKTANEFKLKSEVVAALDSGYEIYKIIKLTRIV